MTTEMAKTRRIRRHNRVRSRVGGSLHRPRLSVFRSNKYLYAQLIDDDAGRTVLGMSDRGISKKKMKKTERAHALGEAFAKKAQEANMREVVFDRGGFRYHGRAKAFAEGARKGGLKF